VRHRAEPFYMMGSTREVLHLPAARVRAPLATHPIATTPTPDEARRFVAIVSAERTVMAALKCERRRFFSADFIAKVVNDSDEELSCSVTGWTHRGSITLEPSAFWIKAQSVAQIPIRAPLRLPYRLRSIALHMQNATLRATAEADVPVPPVLRLAGLLASAASAALVAFMAWRAATPSIQAYTLPSQVAAGDRVTASYAYSGIGTAEYQVTQDGNQIAGDVLSRHQGTFSFPTSRNGALYHVAFSVVGPLATVRRDRLARAISFSPQTGLAISALQPDPSVVRSGQKISVRYVSDATGGTVTLFDASGIALARAAYDSGGVTTLAAPSVDVPTQYRVQLDVTRGTATARASAGLLVMPNDDASPPPPPGMMTAAQLFHMKPRVAAAAMFGVRLLQHPQNLRLTLESGSGVPIQTQRVGPAQDVAYFEAPNVSHDTDYLVEASFTTGNADQVLIQHVLVRVR
jgi:hypothetical protein